MKKTKVKDNNLRHGIFIYFLGFLYIAVDLFFETRYMSLFYLWLLLGISLLILGIYLISKHRGR